MHRFQVVLGSEICLQVWVVHRVTVQIIFAEVYDVISRARHIAGVPPFPSAYLALGREGWGGGGVGGGVDGII